MFVNAKKMTLDTGFHIRFAVHRHLAKNLFNNYKVLFSHQFQQVNWPHVHRTLSEKVPKLFQLWVCQQVMQIAPTNKYMSYRDSRCTKCPCCTLEVEPTEHILHCHEAGKVEAFHATADCLDSWMGEMENEAYLAGRGSESKEAVCFGRPSRFSALACSQDAIGWQGLLERMVSVEIATLQQQHLQVSGSRMSIYGWMTGLIIKLLDITRGQWLYRNVMVHDNTTGTIITKRKEEIQLEIESQQELGIEGLLEEDTF